MTDQEKTIESIKQDIQNHKVVLFMKGTKWVPQCGFSSQVVAILNQLGVDFLARDVLQDDSLREAIKSFSNWPTLPQLYIEGKFIGGCDIVMELYASGELKKHFD